MKVAKKVTGSRPFNENFVISQQNRVYHPQNQASIRTLICTETEAPIGMSQLADQSNPATTQPSWQPERQTPDQKAEEAHKIRRLQRMMNMVFQVLQQDHKLPVERASALVANARQAALAMFPDKEQAFDLIYWGRLQRTMRERYRMQ
jgi:hypothetical protein